MPDRTRREKSLYERLGAETVERLVAAFYARVDNDPVNCLQAEIVRLLVRRGADRHRADRRGATPADVARTDEMKQALAGE